MNSLDTTVRIVALTVFVITMAYNGPLIVMGVLFARRADGSLRRQLALENGPPVAVPAGWIVFVLIPCLNEAKVIANTVHCLLDAQPGVRLVVVDDGSDDDTAALAEAAGKGVTVVQRVLPAARLGKGAALNAGLRHIRRCVENEGLAPERVLVCVLDADGRMTPGSVACVTELFEEPEVGGVQLAVRIRGRDSVALRFQDIEFWALSALSQFGRVAMRAVSMGGNGQFTRLSALDDVGEEPWSDSLTEDLDLGISLAVAGWTVTSTMGAFVSQQGLRDARRLLRQRTRWFQGHMSAMARLPELWSTPGIRRTVRVELTGYLFMPYLITLPWSVIQQYLLFRLAFGDNPGLFDLATGPLWMQVLSGIGLYAITFGPFLIWAVLYWQRTGDQPLWKSIAYLHAQPVWMYVAFIAVWRASWRILRRRTGWVKTERVAETPVTTTGSAATSLLNSPVGHSRSAGAASVADA
ncbi:glycosyltransferase family 2 protein [Nocardia ninae]|uniref:N-acetyl-glucosamine transferase n=1 Tax=Nocardia ninae NBRC 108245 TaxID=1210091 RepID=A0A511ML41_9NOCA|nr:glycosyltransferase family 2 protein [Nocardia ninae]GEM41171.1 N-acetyl-glucosamine transferase [Nocardia ninae NBRC 108245]